tara:strand:+ start:342 stop:722 length:381 start_codon:yes stop_codon:yes gene_type:complete
MSANSGTTLIIGLVVLGCVCSASTGAAAYFMTREDSDSDGGGGGSGWSYLPPSFVNLRSVLKPCEHICGDCSPTQFQYIVNNSEEWEKIESVDDVEAICKGNRSNFTGTQTNWDEYINRIGPNCCP